MTTDTSNSNSNSNSISNIFSNIFSKSNRVNGHNEDDEHHHEGFIDLSLDEEHHSKEFNNGAVNEKPVNEAATDKTEGLNMVNGVVQDLTADSVEEVNGGDKEEILRGMYLSLSGIPAHI
jgi:hypothetical protein